jgi:nucleotide-binding universal stress UspA family protein
LLTVEPDMKGALWSSALEHEGQTFLERTAEALSDQGRTVETTVAFGDPADQILQAATDASLIVIGSHGRGDGGRMLFGSVADRVSRHAMAPTLIMRGGARLSGVPPLTRIVVPLDGARLAESALPMAAELAVLLDQPIHLVRVVDVDMLRATIQAGRLAATASIPSQEAIYHRAEDYLLSESQRLRDRDLVVTSEVRSGQPVTELLDVIKPGDIVVLSTHGRSGISRWLLGSTAEKLIRLAQAPVLLVRPEHVASE